MERPAVKRQSSPAPAELWALNFQLAMSVINETAPAVRRLRLEMKDYFLLVEVDTYPHPADLARVLCYPKASVTFMVKRLVAAGFLRRAIEPDDLRRFHLTLTAAGRRAMEGARAVLDDTFRQRLERLTPPQQAQLFSLLEKLAAV